MENVCHYLPGDMRSIMKKVTNGDIGGGGGGGGVGGSKGTFLWWHHFWMAPRHSLNFWTSTLL